MSGCKPWKNPLVGQLRSQDKDLLVKTFTSIEKWSHQFGGCAGGGNVETWCAGWGFDEGDFINKGMSLSGYQIGPYDDSASVHITVDTTIHVYDSSIGAFNIFTNLSKQNSGVAQIESKCLLAGSGDTSSTRLIGLLPGEYFNFIAAGAEYYTGDIPNPTYWYVEQNISAIIVHGTDVGCFEWGMPS